MPGYRHDAFSSWHSAFVTGSAYGASIHMVAEALPKPTPRDRRRNIDRRA